MYPAKTEPMIKNTTHSSIGRNGMANNDAYSRAENVQEPCKGLHHRGMYATRPNQHEMRPNQSLKVQCNAAIETEPMINNATPPSVAMARQTMTRITTGWRCTRTMQKIQSQRDVCNQTQPTWEVGGRINPSKAKATLLSIAGRGCSSS